MIPSLLCAAGLAVTLVGAIVTELSYLGRIALEERAGRAMMVCGTVFAFGVVLVTQR